MYSVDGTNITLIRGDTLKLIISIKLDGKDYELQSGDVVRFSMKHKYESKEVLISKVIPSDTLLLKLTPDDTKNLPYDFYVYDIQLTYANGDVDTFIKGVIKLTQEVD